VTTVAIFGHYSRRFRASVEEALSFQKLELLVYIWPNNMGLCLLLFTQLSLMVEPLSLNSWHENRV